MLLGEFCQVLGAEVEVMVAERHGRPVEQVGEGDDGLVAELVEPHGALEVVTRVQGQGLGGLSLLQLPEGWIGLVTYLGGHKCITTKLFFGGVNVH